MAGTADEKARGAFFTPEAIADYLAGWAIRGPGDRVLEPSCGEARFLLSAGARLRAFGGRPRWRAQLQGIEIHAASAAAAAHRLKAAGMPGQIRTGDFFLDPPGASYDVILGNPPFIRYQDFTGAARARSLEAALAQGVRLSGLASSWAAFVIRAAEHLAPEGRLALVLPAELLSVGYAAEVRRFLLRRFARLRLVAFEERVFPGVLEDVVLLLAEGSGGASGFELRQTRNAATLAGDDRGWTSYAPGEGEKWTPALMAEGAFAAYEAVRGLACEPLGTWGRTYLGAVTGANGFFALTATEARGLPAADLLPISPPGARHLRGLAFTAEDWRAAVAAGARAQLFRPRDRLSAAARRRVAAGEAAGVATAYKCRVRAPWWQVPLVEVPDLFLTYMNHDRPRLVANHAGVQILNSLYGVRLAEDRRDTGRALLPLACLNSVTLLGAEVVGRSYGGGLLKLEPREADTLPVPSLAVVTREADRLAALRPKVEAALAAGAIEAATALVDPVLFGAADLTALRLAREMLFRRRRTRGGNGTH